MWHVAPQSTSNLSLYDVVVPAHVRNEKSAVTYITKVDTSYVDDTFVIFGSELECDRFHENLNQLHPALKFTVDKEQNNSLNFLDVSVEKGDTGFLTSIYRKPTFTGQYIRWNSFSPKPRKINLIKTLVHRALMICSKTKLDSELDTIKQLLIENGYPEDVLVSCIKEKLATISSEKRFGPEKCPVYLKLPWIGNVSSKFENQIHKAITSCFYAVKPCAVYNTRVMLSSAKKDSVPTTQISCVVYEFSCRCEARYVGRTTQRLADRIKQHVPTSIRTKNTTTREQPPRTCKNSNSKMKSDSASHGVSQKGTDYVNFTNSTHSNFQVFLKINKLKIIYDIPKDLFHCNTDFAH